MRTIKLFLALLLLTVFILGMVFFVGFLNFKKEAAYSMNRVATNADLAANALKNLETGQAKYSLQIIKNEIGLWLERFQLISNFIPPLQEIPKKIKVYSDLADSSVVIAEKLDFLKNSGLQLILRQDGKQLVGVLKEVQKELARVSQSIHQERIYEANNLLTAVIGWLTSDEPQHLLILFQNSSEIRPGGGFLGSFAHLTLKNGGLTNLEVNDIYDFDGQLTLKLVPPPALQTVTSNWGARDANWFLDFPTSARKVIKFLEASRIHQDRGIKFAGAIAINDTVMTDILKVLGPIEIDEPPLILNADNFLSEIQIEVETKQNKGVLKKITPIIFDRLNKLNRNEQKKKLLEIFKNKFTNKDIMIYLENPIMESFLKLLEVGGEWFEIPNNFSGDYLAVVNANVAGGKTDQQIHQTISLISEIGRDNIVKNKLDIGRDHQPSDRKERWYNVVNQNFIQIFTPKNSDLTFIAGGDAKIIKPAIDYKKAGYETDPDLEAKRDKNVFTAWLNIPPGEFKNLELEYERTLNLDFAAETIPYVFIFDKQSGVNGILQLQLMAPTGFIWKENHSQIFKYYTDNPPSRIKLDLNLIRGS